MSHYGSAIIGLIGVLVGAAITAGFEFLRYRDAASKRRTGALNLLSGLLDNLAGWAEAATHAGAPLSADASKLWRGTNSLLVSTLSNPTVMESLDKYEAAALWGCANVGTMTTEAINKAGADAPELAKAAFDYYEQALKKIGR